MTTTEWFERFPTLPSSAGPDRIAKTHAEYTMLREEREAVLAWLENLPGYSTGIARRTVLDIIDGIRAGKHRE